jgi:hypothetical protein
MKKSFIMLFAVILSPLLALAQKPVEGPTSIVVIPFEGIEQMPCTGDMLSLTGELVFFAHGNGNDQRYLSNMSFFLRSVTGTNLRTGEKYLYVGGFQSLISYSTIDGRRSSRVIVRYNLIGQGTAVNISSHMVLIQRYNKLGELETDIDKQRVECM